MNKTDFIKNMVTITRQQDGTYGYFPFNLIAIDPENKATCVAFAGVNSVHECYLKFAQYQTGDSTKIYMALDYPANPMIKKDFIGLFIYEEGTLKISLLPYSPATGIMDVEILDNSVVSLIRLEYVRILEAVKRIKSAAAGHKQN